MKPETALLNPLHLEPPYSACCTAKLATAVSSKVLAISTKVRGEPKDQFGFDIGPDRRVTEDPRQARN